MMQAWLDEMNQEHENEKARKKLRARRHMKMRIERPPGRFYVFQPFKLEVMDYKCDSDEEQEVANDLYPRARSGHRMVCNNSDIYVYGGFNPAIQEVRTYAKAFQFQEVWRYSLFSKRWTKLFYEKIHADILPVSLSSPSALLADKTLIIYGGTGYPFGEKCSNDCHIIRPYDRTIMKLKTFGEEPDKTYGQSTFLHGQWMYVVGGTDGLNYNCDVHRLNISTGEWQVVVRCQPYLETDPAGCYRHGVAFDREHELLYIIGGGSNITLQSFELLPMLDLKTGIWSEARTFSDPFSPDPGIPETRLCHSMVQYDTDMGPEIVITGGCRGRDIQFNDIWKLNLRTLRWSLFQEAQLPYNLYFHDAATSGNGLMYVFGGVRASRDHSVSSRINEVYTMWTTIPKLSEIAWQAMLYYAPNMARMKRSHLIKMGIPANFVKRILLGRDNKCNFASDYLSYVPTSPVYGENNIYDEHNYFALVNLPDASADD